MFAPRGKIIFITLLFTALVTTIDQYIKGLVAPDRSLQILPKLLEISYTTNSGTAFGLFHDAPRELVLGINILILGVFCALIWPHLNSRLGVAITALVLGGAFGNINDRIRLHFVRDYIFFHIGDRFRWPIFNLADACVVIGVGLLLLKIFYAEKNISSRTKGDITPHIEEQ